MSIRCFCNYLVGTNDLDDNVLIALDSVRVKRGKPNVLHDENIDILISTINGRVPKLRASNVRRDVSIVLMLHHSGLRASELCDLNLVDVNIKHRKLLVKGKGRIERIVPTTRQCADSITEYIENERQSQSEAVFVKSDGQRITRRTIGDMLASLSRRAGIQHTTPHMLRRSCATNLMNRGVDLDLVRVLLGHKTLSTTQDYLAVDDDRLMDIHSRCHPFGEKYAS